MATILLLVIYLAFIGLGLPDSLLGSGWPAIHGELGIPVSWAGFASVVVTGGTVVSSLLSERVIRRFGTGRTTALSVAMTALALAGVSLTGRFGLLLLLCVPLGLGAGTVDAALNNFVATHYSSRDMNWLHCFWGVGATLSPLIMALFLGRRQWRGAYMAVAAALALIALAVTLAMPLWRRMGDLARQGQGGKAVPKKELLGLPGAALACAAFFAYCSLESSVGLWASTYLVTVRGMAQQTAASWGSAFYLGVTGGRLISGFAAMKLSDRALIRIGWILILAGVGLLIPPLGGGFPAAGLLLVGLGCAPIFPCMLDRTPALFGRRYSQGMMGLQMAGAYLGSSLMAPLFGWIAPAVGMGAWPLYLAGLLAVLIVATERLGRLPESGNTLA